MDLILWRHAQAYDPSPSVDDSARALTPRGHKQAIRMAQWLDQHMPHGAKIWASPALRTVQTASALERKFSTHEALALGASPAQLLDLVGWPQGKGCVLVVGHQPTLGQTIASLLKLQTPECSLKKGAFWWLRTMEGSDPLEVSVVTVQTPEFF
jgi:phosphohistidine phosphatase